MSGKAPDAAAGDAAPALRAAILAGGGGRRMGGPKAGVELAGRPLIAHPIAAVRLAGLAPFVVAKPATPLPELRCPLVTEPAEPQHPLAGVVAALEHAEAPIVVLACDLPLLPAELIAELANRRARFAMPAEPAPQPLVARYTPGLLPLLREGLAGGRPLREVAAAIGGDALRAAELRGFGDPERMFANVNDREELRRIEADLGA